MYECDGSGGVRDCNEGRHWFWVILWNKHNFRQESRTVYPGGYGEAHQIDRCTICGTKEEYDTPGGP